MCYKRLREMRERHHLSQRQLAAELDMPQPQYNRYERGLRDIPTAVLIQLARIYNTSADYLLELTDDPVPYPKSEKES
ncbi:MAG: helix-turn-helix domain-containing protein [Clostridiales bacterium]|nr:helix-turn-helix domain-containing protein [Clostridiales bacterium]